MTPQQRDDFEANGFLVIPGALSEAEVEFYEGALDRTYEAEKAAGRLLSVKLAFWLSDVSEPGRGNLKLVPGSHLKNWVQGPPGPGVQWPDPEGAIEVCVNPGDVVLFDRRMWHARSDNHSEITRKAGAGRVRRCASGWRPPGRAR